MRCPFCLNYLHQCGKTAPCVPYEARNPAEISARSPNEVSAGNARLDEQSLPPSTLVRELVGALEALLASLDETDPSQHLVSTVAYSDCVSALLRAREEMEGLQTNGEKPSADAQERRSGGEP